MVIRFLRFLSFCRVACSLSPCSRFLIAVHHLFSTSRSEKSAPLFCMTRSHLSFQMRYADSVHSMVHRRTAAVSSLQAMSSPNSRHGAATTDPHEISGADFPFAAHRLVSSFQITSLPVAVHENRICSIDSVWPHVLHVARSFRSSGMFSFSHLSPIQYIPYGRSCRAIGGLHVILPCCVSHAKSSAR